MRSGRQAYLEMFPSMEHIFWIGTEVKAGNEVQDRCTLTREHRVQALQDVTLCGCMMAPAASKAPKTFKTSIYSIFWVIMKLQVLWDRRSGTTHRSHSLTLENGTETSVSNHLTPRNKPEDGWTQLVQLRRKPVIFKMSLTANPRRKRRPWKDLDRLIQRNL
jgi:hypothetical protein